MRPGARRSNVRKHRTCPDWTFPAGCERPAEPLKICLWRSDRPTAHDANLAAKRCFGVEGQPMVRRFLRSKLAQGGFSVDSISPCSSHVQIKLPSDRQAGRSLDCCPLNGRVRSHYVRRPADLPPAKYLVLSQRKNCRHGEVLRDRGTPSPPPSHVATWKMAAVSCVIDYGQFRYPCCVEQLRTSESP